MTYTRRYREAQTRTSGRFSRQEQGVAPEASATRPVLAWTTNNSRQDVAQRGGAVGGARNVVAHRGQDTAGTLLDLLSPFFCSLLDQ